MENVSIILLGNLFSPVSTSIFSYGISPPIFFFTLYFSIMEKRQISEDSHESENGAVTVDDDDNKLPIPVLWVERP